MISSCTPIVLSIGNIEKNREMQMVLIMQMVIRAVFIWQDKDFTNIICKVDVT